MSAHEPEPMIQFFAYEHLPPHLQDHSKPFFALAEHLIATLPRNPERTTALRKLFSQAKKGRRQWQQYP